MLSLIL
jgi:hypothetical protein